MSYWISQSVDGAPLPKAVCAEGVYVYGEDGKRYIDSTGGPGLFSLGHGHPEVTEAIKNQFDQLAYGFSMTFTTDVVEELSETIVTAAGADHFGGVFYSSSGSEANEHALKAALQYHLARMASPSGSTSSAANFPGTGRHSACLTSAITSGGGASMRDELGRATHVSAPMLYRPPEGVAHRRTSRSTTRTSSTPRSGA